ncbi:MAG TPA: hypothetical protein VLN90_04015, partial [Thioalkalivibrio sp.]|nr:hypothetical protein [Thioalkalivibrio sp.]
MQSSLRTQMALLLAVLVSGTLLLAGLLAMQQSARALTDRIGEGLLNQSHSVAIDLDSELLGLADQLSLASASDSFRTQASRTVRQHDLTLIQSLFPGLTWIGTTSAEGVVQVATGGHLEGADISSRSVFQGGLNGAFLGGRHPALLLQTLLRPDEPAWQVMDVATPLLDEHGHAYGVLVAHMGWDWLVQR